MSEDVSKLPTLPDQSLVRKWLTILGPFLGLLFVIVTFAVLTGSPEKYLSPFNIRVGLSQTVIVAIGAIGMSMIIISGGLCLSLGPTNAAAGVRATLGLHS